MKKYVQVFDMLCGDRKQSEEWVHRTLNDAKSIFVKPFFEMVIKKCKKNEAFTLIKTYKKKK